MATVDFYRDLTVLESFAETIETARHTQVPGDWWIVVADVVGSTKAIEAGAYKKVNTVGVACIAAVINVDRSVEMPFVFGGDGATFAVPGSLLERIVAALREAQRLSRQSFELSLRPITSTASPPAPPPAPPPNGHALNDQGYELLRAHQAARAVPLLRRAVSALRGAGPTDPYEAYANYNLGLALIQTQRCSEAVDRLRLAQRLEGGGTVAKALRLAERCA